MCISLNVGIQSKEMVIHGLIYIYIYIYTSYPIFSNQGGGAPDTLGLVA